MRTCRAMLPSRDREQPNQSSLPPEPRDEVRYAAGQARSDQTSRLHQFVDSLVHPIIPAHAYRLPSAGSRFPTTFFSASCIFAKDRRTLCRFYLYSHGVESRYASAYWLLPSSRCAYKFIACSLHEPSADKWIALSPLLTVQHRHVAPLLKRYPRQVGPLFHAWADLVHSARWTEMTVIDLASQRPAKKSGSPSRDANRGCGFGALIGRRSQGVGT